MKHLHNLLLICFLILTFQITACSPDKPTQETVSDSNTTDTVETTDKNSPTQVIAQILSKLNHFPSDSEKTMLKNITTSASASEAEKTIAEVLINVQHSASDADKTRLKKIMDDASVSAENRQLAEIVHNLNHQPSAEDKNTLQAILQ